MNPTYYHILHLFSLFVLTAHTFMAFANPQPENKKKTLIITGIAGLLVLISGFGLLAKLYPGTFPGWVIVKFVAWLGLVAFSGVVFRRPHLRDKLSLAALTAILISIVMVYLKPL